MNSTKSQHYLNQEQWKYTKIDSFKNIEDPGGINIQESKRKLNKFVLIKSFNKVSSFLKKRGMFTNILLLGKMLPYLIILTIFCLFIFEKLNKTKP